MRKFTLLFVLLCTAISFAQTPIELPDDLVDPIDPIPISIPQNQSFKSVKSVIDSPIPQQFSGGEIFRFRPGLVTQLDSGNSFGFTSSRWFSIGRLNTGSQNVYGLRFQLPNRALTMGYQDINDTNPRLQWIGAGSSAGTDFEFRVASSFTSTTSKLVATMTNDGSTFFGTPLSTTEAKVGIDYSDISGSTRTGLFLQNTSGSGSYHTAIKSVNNKAVYVKTGMDIQSSGNSYGNTGINVRLSEAFYNTGISTSVTGSNNGSTYGVRGFIYGPSGVTPTGFGAAIYGSSATTSNRFAGYFNGNVFVTGTFTASDKKLKDNIKEEVNVLDKLEQLDAVTYTFKPNDQLNLPEGLQHGFLAQDIEKVFPELISTINKPIFDEENKQTGSYEYKAVNYVGMISILTSSLKELKEESAIKIKQLEEESAANMQDLNEKVALLESQIQALTGNDAVGETKLDTQEEISGSGFSMEQNKPNPFTNQTVINYTLPSNTKATISVVDLSGKFIKDYNLSSEKGQLTINSSEIGKGIFVYALISDNEVMITKKMIIR
ncbi:chaperone of endosialidase [Kordia sp. SMS9]|uniref:tail fiber domain-containing protein n=1 Tax=Kordia sp. SMS9 TaxID=2282170 RepID=UPI000E10E102|nr:tail fiber domain-containing protein [Kordia sp. SMS9]AXG69675.1 chaperone of endosialidase [Kordia sp. SMS9]